MKIRCLLCGRLVKDSFEGKWKHLLKKHPEEMFSRLLPMVCDVSQVRAVGIEAGRRLRENVISKFSRSFV